MTENQNLALYRKYRPQSFSEVIGQEHIVKTLKNSIAGGKIAHAYLFCGPRGTGKTTIARILAKSINCDVQKNGDPCNKCQNCKDINSGRALDVVEIDAASNTGVDNIRELTEGVKFSPNQLKYKVFIIDEVHMLSKGAFNALLKTLEEPPAHAIFALATTEIEKVPETILSRVQRFDFKKASVNQIIDKLRAIVKHEKVKADDDVFRLVAQLAEGGFRDAESILTRILSVSGDKITVKDVEEIAGVTNFNKVSDFIDLISKKQVKETIKHLNNLQDDGVDMQEFLRASMRYLRNMLLAKIDVNIQETSAPELTEEQIQDIIARCKNFKQEELQELLNSFIKAEELMKKTSIPLLPIELAVLKSLNS